MNQPTNKICNILSFLNKYKHRNLYYAHWEKNYKGILTDFRLYLIRNIKPIQNIDAFSFDVSEIIAYAYYNKWYGHNINDTEEFIIGDKQIYFSFKTILQYKSTQFIHHFICDETKLNSLLHSSIIMDNISQYKSEFKNKILITIQGIPNIPYTWTIN
jgi:hypothetical protein